MRKNKLIAGVLSAAMVMCSLTLPENINIGGFDFGTLFTLADLDDTEYNAYLIFMTGDYSFRNAWDDSSYGLNSGYDYSVVHSWDGSKAGTFVDAVINGEGTYTVSICGLDLSTSYNTLGISTDIPCDSADITIDNVTIGGEEFDNPDVYVIEDSDYIWLLVINLFDDLEIGDYEATSSQDTSITFTVSKPTVAIVDSGTCGENLTWTLDSDGVLTISGTGEMYDYAYSTSPWYDYDYINNITTIKIEDGVTSIGNYAFAYCNMITNVDISDSVTSIGERAFCGCDMLTGIDIPDSVTFIGGSAFYDCDNLTEVNISDRLTSIESSTFGNCSSLANIEIPTSVTSIGYNAFSDCSSLASIKIPSSVTTIGASAFSGCSSLTSIEISSGVTSIGNYAFSGCKLTSIDIPASVTDMSSYTFDGCSGLKKINVSDDSESYASADGIVYTKDMTLLIVCPEAKDGKVVIPDGVTSIGNGAFSDCTALTEIEIPESVTSIGYEAFSGCSGLTRLEKINEEIEIGSGAFSGCTGLGDENGCVIFYDVLYAYVGEASDVVISDGVTKIKELIYNYEERCRITSIVIPEGVTEIESMAFHHYCSLNSIELPDSLTSVGRLAFSECDLEEIEIPASVTYIGEYAFGYFWQVDSMGESIQPWKKVTIYGYEGSAAEKYVEEYGTYEYWDESIEEVVTFVSLTISGDANGDDEINYLDAMAVLRYDAELMEMTTVQLAAADVNDDGSVNSLDAILILRYDAGLIEEF